MAMKVVKKTDDFIIYSRRDGRYAGPNHLTRGQAPP